MFRKIKKNNNNKTKVLGGSLSSDVSIKSKHWTKVD